MLLLNLVSANAFWQVAVGLAVCCLIVGAVFGFQARRLRIRERRGDF